MPISRNPLVRSLYGYRFELPLSKGVKSVFYFCTSIELAKKEIDQFVQIISG
jgi:hypothetical protein